MPRARIGLIAGAVLVLALGAAGVLTLPRGDSAVAAHETTTSAPTTPLPQTASTAPTDTSSTRSTASEGSAAPASSAAVTTPAATGAGQAPALAGDPTSWRTYTNGRFSYAALVPPDFVATAPPADGSGQGFLSPDGHAEMTAWGHNNVLGDSPASFLASAVSSFEANGGTVTYRSSVGPVVAVSGVFVHDGVRSVYYQRAVVATGSVQGFDWTYPVADKTVYDQLVERTAKGFRPSDPTATGR